MVNVDDVESQYVSDNDETSSNEVRAWKLFFYSILTRKLTKTQHDGLKTHHQIPIDAEVSTQKEKAKDVRLIFTDLVFVKFTEKDGTGSLLKGCWCKPCR
jgi:hypothetical protein